MKQVNLWNGKGYVVSDEKLKSIIQALAEGETKSIVDIGDGTGFIISALSDWGDIETEPYFMGNKMNKSMTRVFVQGEWKQFCGDKREIEMRPVLSSNKLLQ